METMRLDKFISNAGIGSRTDAKKIIKSGRITVDGVKVKSYDIKVQVNKNIIKLDGKEIIYKKYTYIIMNKPAGVICATFDKKEKTVIDLLEEKYKNLGLFPVGRLDKDTVGLIILTNDGEFAHNTLSPRKHVSKIYYAHVEGTITEDDIIKFKNGIIIENYKCKDSELKVLSIDNGHSIVNVEIQEGKFHQIKRMFLSLGKKVIYLRRIKFGNIELDKNIKEGMYREFNEDEMKKMQEFMGK